MSKFGWSLPPGCTMADIDRAYGGDGIEEAFESQADLTKEELEAWEDSTVGSLVCKALEWACDCGYKGCQANMEEAKYYEEQFKFQKEESMSLPGNLTAHQQDYREGAWDEYTDEELEWWVKLFTKRASHRTSPEKKAKDLYDASNYQAILDKRKEA